MTVTVYRSTDGSAPTLTNAIGQMLLLLDAILVDGYAGKSSQGWTKSTLNTCTGIATGGANNKLIDTGSDFIAKGVFIGQGVVRNADGKIGYITSISTTTNPNDTLNYTSGGTAPTFANLDAYTILAHRRVYTPPAGSLGRPLVVSDFGFGATTYCRVQGWESFTGFVPGKATGGANNKLIDTTKEFVNAGVVVGNWVRRTADNKSAQITSISTTTNANDTLNFTAGTYTPTFAANDGYEVLVGIGQFPTDTQQTSYLAGGMYTTKSSSAIARDWILVGNGKLFHFANCYGGSANQWNGMSYGDFTPVLGGDVYATIIWATGAAGSPGWLGKASLWVPRIYAGTGIAYNIVLLGTILTNATYVGYSTMTYPNPEDSRLYLAKLMITEASLNLRGVLPGIWEPLHAKTNFTSLDTCNGTGNLAGKTFIVIRCTTYGGSEFSGAFLETSDTW